MNTVQEQMELGKLVKERREIKSRFSCTKKKLVQYSKTLEQTAFSMVHSDIVSGFRFSDNSDEFAVLSVSGVMGFEKVQNFPSREQISNLLKDFIYLKNRLAELDDLLD